MARGQTARQVAESTGYSAYWIGQLARRYSTQGPTRCAIGRASKRLVPRLLAGWGDDWERYASAASVQALAGTSPVAYERGKYAKAHRRYACVKPFRNVLYQFAWQSTFQEAWAVTYYRRKRQEGKVHSMAVRALANVWVRIIHAMWLPRRPYAETTFLAV